MAIMSQKELQRFDGQAYWFLAHGIVDLVIAIPLLVAPVAFLEWLGWADIDVFTARIVAAALIAIGVESLLGYRAEFYAVRAMLNLKILWAVAAIVGILWSALAASDVPWGTWPILGLFVVFLISWIVWRIRVSGFAGK
jgi:hypothetical protein